MAPQIEPEDAVPIGKVRGLGKPIACAGPEAVKEEQGRPRPRLFVVELCPVNRKVWHACTGTSESSRRTGACYLFRFESFIQTSGRGNVNSRGSQWNWDQFITRCVKIHEIDALRYECPIHSGALMARRIKRYDNRKLYDTEASEYVSLSDVAALVRSGETVEVVDNATGEDLTAQTLTQIILEEGKNGHNVIPSDLLHQLLRRSEEMVDSGIDQIRSTVDDLMQSSLGRLKRLVQTPRAQELDELRSQLRQLEHRLSFVRGHSRRRGGPVGLTLHPLLFARSVHNQSFYP